MEQSAGQDEIADNGGASNSTLATKRKRTATDGASSSAAAGGICDDDTVGTILARLHARKAIACTTLSKHHRSLILSSEFRRLHRRLGAPLPSPHIAYLAPAAIRRRPEHHHLASQYYGFHLAGAGLAGDAPAPIRSIAGLRYFGTSFVNSCHGVLLLATKGFSSHCRCTLWNPAVADAAREATIPRPSPERSEPAIVLPDGSELRNKETQFMALGLGYGQRSNTYKFLLCRRNKFWIHRPVDTHGATNHFEDSLLVHSLGNGNGCDDATCNGNKGTQLRTVLSMEFEPVKSNSGQVDREVIQSKSLYMDDGKIYFVCVHQKKHTKKHMILAAFDVDDETVCAIDMVGEGHEAVAQRFWWSLENLQLIEMSGRVTLVIKERDCIALWQLMANHQLERTHVVSYKKVRDLHNSNYKIAGVWECDGILLLWFHEWASTEKLLLYNTAAKKMFKADMPDGP